MQEEIIIYKYRLKVKKNKELKFISHLDWQNLILKIFRRCELKLVLSQGFNKMPKVSYSPALPIFIESNCELVNFQTYEKLDADFLKNFDKFSSQGIEVVEFKELSSNPDNSEPKSLENLCQWAKYEAYFENKKNNIYNFEKIRYIIDKCLSSDKFLITKKTKKGIEKTINYRKSIKLLELRNNNSLGFILKTGQNEEIPALRADEFLKILFNLENEQNTQDILYNIFKIKRINFFDTNMRII